ncbi:carotenoid biosynthesis protein [Luedemannella helvata]|uniref:Carotenoid biosynthesis protein n=1 Tax=Luedemannella helvata TaxID=349315 RepID=A0ABP4VTA6_9ACTN
MRLVWTLLAALVAAEICYPLTTGAVRAALVVVTVLLGFAASLAHAITARGARAGAALLGVAAAGFAVELLGVRTGVPFGGYDYAASLGPQLGGVPLLIGLAWAWMAWPAWLAAGRLVTGRSVRAGVARVVVAAVALAAWDLFLDPQMVADGHWVWHDPDPALPGVTGVPLGNYLGWLLVALIVATGLTVALGHARPSATDAPMLALYLWTYASSVLAHAAFLSLPASAAWGALGMGLVAVPLAISWRRGATP